MPYVDPVVDDVLSDYLGRQGILYERRQRFLQSMQDAIVVPVRKSCRLPECHGLGAEKFEGYCVIHWHNLQSWLRRKQ